MLKIFEKYWFPLFALLGLVSFVSFFFWPSLSYFLELGIIVLSFSLAVIFISRKYSQSYQQAECTREKMIHNLALDLLGLLLTMGAALYVGRLAGGYIGLRVGFWIGLLAGFIGGFIAAWVVRTAWGRLVALA